MEEGYTVNQPVQIDDDVMKLVDAYRQNVKAATGKMMMRQRAINDVLREHLKGVKANDGVTLLEAHGFRLDLLERAVFPKAITPP